MTSSFFPDFQTSRVPVHGLHVDARRTQMSLTAGRVLAEGNLEPVGVEVPRSLCLGCMITLVFRRTWNSNVNAFCLVTVVTKYLWTK